MMEFVVLCLVFSNTHTELPSLLPVVQLSEALLRLEKGPHLLTRLIANMPDTFDQGTCSQMCRGVARRKLKSGNMFKHQRIFVVSKNHIKHNEAF